MPPPYKFSFKWCRCDGVNLRVFSTLCALAQYHAFSNSDSNTFYVNKATELAKQINYPFGKLRASIELFFAVNLKSNYTKALEIALKNLKIASKSKDDSLYQMALVHLNLILVDSEIGGLCAVAITLFTVSFKALKAVIGNPVKNMRTE